MTPLVIAWLVLAAINGLVLSLVWWMQVRP